MVLPNEINKKVRCGQLRHGVISGCLAVAGQLPLLLEALLYRHRYVYQISTLLLYDIDQNTALSNS